MLDRWMKMIRANLTQMLSRAEDPKKMLNEVIHQMQVQLVEAKKQVAAVTVDERRLRRQVEDATSTSANWERNAMLAVRAGDDRLAREALQRKNEYAQLAIGLGQQWEAHRKSADTLRAALDGLSAKIEEARRTRGVLIARLRGARARQTVAQTLAGMNVSSPAGVLGQMEQRVIEAEVRAEAAADLSAPTLEEQFRALEAGRVEDDLAALKRKLGLPGVGRRVALRSVS